MTQEFDSNIIEIRKLSTILNEATTNHVVHISYEGLELGQMKPWLIKIHNDEFRAADKESAASELLTKLKNDLRKKILGLENKAAHYKNALISLEN